MSSPTHSNPWITAGIRRKSRKKQRLYNKAKKSNNPKDWESYKKFQKELHKNVKKNYWSYQNNIISDPSDTSQKAFWRFIKSKKQDSPKTPPLKSGNKVVFDAEARAKIFNTQFTSVFTQEDQSNIPALDPTTFPSAANIHVSIEGVQKLLSELKCNKATGPDQISAHSQNPLS